MKRKFELLKSHIECECYLLFKGMWKGESKLTAQDFKNKTIFISACTGSFFDGTLCATKTFYKE